MSVGEWVGVIGLMLGVAGSTLAGARWALRMSIREDMQPLRDAILALTQTAKQLTNDLRDAKAEQREGRDELHEAVDAIRAVLNNHETRLTVLERDDPPPAMRARRKAS
jgi:hypothetical protein